MDRVEGENQVNHNEDSLLLDGLDDDASTSVDNLAVRSK
jgi:hypothetical protein